MIAGLFLGTPTTANAAPTAAATASPWDRQPNPTAVQADAWFENVTFHGGRALKRVKIHYATLGNPHRDARNIDNAVLLLHWTGADSRVLLGAGYTSALFASGRPLDAGRYYLIIPDAVGHGQSSKPSDGLGREFPDYDYGDIVALQHRLVTETLGVAHLHAIVGMSMGGMNAWQWAEAYPDAMDGVMPVVSLPIRISGRNLLWRRMVIDAIRSDAAASGADSRRGWVLGYRVLRLMIDSALALQHEVPDEAAADRFLAATRAQADGVDPNDILYSLKSSFTYDPEPQLSRIKAKLFALNFSDDEFNPDELQALEARVPKLAHGRYVVQPGTASSPGHLTMTRPELWAQHVATFMRWIADAPNECTDNVGHEP